MSKVLCSLLAANGITDTGWTTLSPNLATLPQNVAVRARIFYIPKLAVIVNIPSLRQGVTTSQEGEKSEEDGFQVL